MDNPARPPARTAILFALLLLLPLAPGPAAQTDAVAHERSLLTELPLVLSVTRLTQPQAEAPAAVTVIDREMIRASGAMAVTDLLRLVPGFQVAMADGHARIATAHGLSNDNASRMQVLIDGRSVYLPSRGGPFWSEIPLALDDIERIEVIRGPNAAVYGANAFLGTINIFTRPPATDQPLRARLALGSHGLQQRSLSHAGRLPGGAYRATLAYRRDDGFAARHDDQRITLATWRHDWQLDPGQRLELRAGYNAGLRQEGLLRPGAANAPHDREVTSHYFQLGWEANSQAQNTHRLNLYHNRRNADELFTTSPISAMLGLAPAQIPALLRAGRPDQALQSDIGMHEQRSVIGYHNDRRLDDQRRLSWGLELRDDRARSPGWYNSNRQFVSRRYQLFGNLEQRLGTDWLLNLGLMGERISGYGSDLSPRLALNYRIDPRHSLRLSASRALRLPTLDERHVDATLYLDDGSPFRRYFASDPELEPEVIQVYELGLLGQAARLALSWDLRLFHERIHDRIFLAHDLAQPNRPFIDALGDPIPPTEVYTNLGDIRINGAELALRYRPARDRLFSLAYARMQAGGQILRRLNPEQRVAVYDQVPRATLSLFAMQRWSNGLQASALYYRNSPMRWVGTGQALGRVERLDLRLGQRISRPGLDLDLALVVHNLLDDYPEFEHINRFDTRYYLELSLQWF